MNKINKLIKFIITASVLIACIWAQGGNRIGTAGATEVLIPIGARGIAMGGATLVGSAGADGLFWNPANAARSKYSTDVMLSHMNHIADIDVLYGAIVFGLGELGNIGLSIKSLNIGEIEQTSRQYPDGTGVMFEPSFTVVGATYSKMLNDRISVGLGIKYVSEKIQFVSASGVAFDAGVTYTNFANVKGLGIAIVLKNIAQKLKYEGSGLYRKAKVDGDKRRDGYLSVVSADFNLPASYEFAVSYDYALDKINKFQVVGAFKNNNYWYKEGRAGFEYAFNDLIFLRGGYIYNFDFDIKKTDAPTDFTAGFGLKYSTGSTDIILDYAYQTQKYFDANHVVTLRLGL